MTDFFEEAQREKSAREAIHRWVKARADAVRNHVTAHDVLRRNGIKLRYSGDREEQFSCPFHGVDRRPSARVYPESVRSKSHVWCFVCQKHWDAIALWRLFMGSGTEIKFSRTLAEIEKAYGIVPPERPPTAAEMEDYEDPEVTQCELLFDICERRLLNARNDFDMRAFLTLGSVLDRAHYKFEQGSLSPDRTKDLLQQVMDKIAEKVRTCPAG